MAAGIRLVMYLRTSNAQTRLRTSFAIARIETATEIRSGADCIGNYELEVRDPGKEHEDPKLTLRWHGI